MKYYSCAATEPFISITGTRNCAFDSVLESYVSDSSLGEKTEETSIQMIPNPIGRLCNSNSIIHVHCFVANWYIYAGCNIICSIYRVMCYVGYCDHLFYSVKCDFTLDDQYIFLLHC